MEVDLCPKVHPAQCVGANGSIVAAAPQTEEEFLRDFERLGVADETEAFMIDVRRKLETRVRACLDIYKIQMIPAPPAGYTVLMKCSHFEPYRAPIPGAYILKQRDGDVKRCRQGNSPQFPKQFIGHPTAASIVESHINNTVTDIVSAAVEDNAALYAKDPLKNKLVGLRVLYEREEPDLLSFRITFFCGLPTEIFL
jgi:hypothetical protein